MASSTIMNYDERKVSHKWLIKNFKEHIDKSLSKYESYTVGSSTFPLDSKTAFTLDFKCFYENCLACFYLYLTCCKFEKTEIIKSELYILDNENIKHKAITLKYSTKETTFSRRKMFFLKELEDNEPILFPNNILTIGCDVFAHNSSTNILCVYRRNPEYLIGNQFKELLNNENSSDFTFQVDDQIIKVHKLILMTRSPVFRAMFESEMLEKKNNKATVKDIRPEIFKIMIEFIYTDKVANDSLTLDEVIELLVTADKYQLDSLADNCGELMLKLIDFNNTMKILLLAEQYNIEQLIVAVQNFIKGNKQEVLNNIDLDYFKKHGHHANIFLF